MAVVVRRYYTAHIVRWGRSMAFIKATKRRHRTRHRNAANSLYFGRSQVPEMVRSSWMAKKFTRGMTHHWKAKDMVNVREVLYGVANIVLYHYNERVLNCRGSRGIGVPEQKSCYVYKFFGHPGVHHTHR
jgi:hypothetical protein